MINKSKNILWLGKWLGGLIIAAGWILSPLTWWNDWLVNIPLAWLLASLFVGPEKHIFGILFILFYWFSNLLGMLMMFLGWKFYKNEKKWSKKELMNSFLISIVYTLVILILIRFGVLKPLL